MMTTLSAAFERAGLPPGVKPRSAAKPERSAVPHAAAEVRPPAGSDELLAGIVRARDSIDRAQRTGARVFQRLLPAQQDAWRALGLCDTYLCWTTALLKQRIAAERRKSTRP